MHEDIGAFEELGDFIRAIQADALKSAADAIEGVGREGRDFAPKSFWETLSREQGAKIRSLIPTESRP